MRHIALVVVLLCLSWSAQAVELGDIAAKETDAVPAQENAQDWARGLEILREVSHKELGSEFSYKCKGRWETDQICKYIWATSNAYRRQRWGRALKFAAAGLKLNPRVEQLNDYVGSLLPCSAAMPFLERSDDYSTYLHCRDVVASTFGERRRGRRLFRAHAEVAEGGWEYYRLASSLYDEGLVRAGDVALARIKHKKWRLMTAEMSARVRGASGAMMSHVLALYDEEPSALNGSIRSAVRLAFSEKPGLDAEDLLRAVSADHEAGARENLISEISPQAFENRETALRTGGAQTTDDVLQFGRLGIRLWLVEHGNEPLPEAASEETKFFYWTAKRDLAQASYVSSSSHYHRAMTSWMKSDCSVYSKVERIVIYGADVESWREVPWHRIWGLNCKATTNPASAGNWVKDPTLKALHTGLTAMIVGNRVVMGTTLKELRGSDFVSAQIVAMWIAAHLGDAEEFERAWKLVEQEGAYAWFDPLARLVLLARQNNVEAVRAVWSNLPRYAKEVGAVDAREGGWLALVIREVAKVDASFAAQMTSVYFGDAPVAKKILE